jgi:PPOX class probable F420-dependent enzyme
MTTADSDRWNDGEIERFLAEQRVGRMGTIDAHGYPHVVPMWHTVVDGLLYISFRTAGKQKLTNLRRNPRMSYTVDAGGDVSEYRGVLLRGDAEVVEDPGLLARYHEAWLYRHFGTPRHPYYQVLTSVERTVIQLEPKHVVTWGQTQQHG